MKAIHFHVSGRVQGVFFRDTTRRTARGLDLGGWVRNLRDGRVEGWAEGDESALDEFVDYLHEGPPRARVDGVDVQATEPEGHATFRVRR